MHSKAKRAKHPTLEENMICVKKRGRTSFLGMVLCGTRKCVYGEITSIGDIRHASLALWLQNEAVNQLLEECFSKEKAKLTWKDKFRCCI